MRIQIATLAIVMLCVNPGLAEEGPPEPQPAPDWMVALVARPSGPLTLENPLDAFARHGAGLAVERRVLPHLWLGAEVNGRASMGASQSDAADGSLAELNASSRSATAIIRGALTLRPELELTPWLALSLPMALRPGWSMSASELRGDDLGPPAKSNIVDGGVSANVGFAVDLVPAPMAHFRLGADIASLGASYVGASGEWFESRAWSVSGGARLTPWLAFALAF